MQKPEYENRQQTITFWRSRNSNKQKRRNNFWNASKHFCDRIWAGSDLYMSSLYSQGGKAGRSFSGTSLTVKAIFGATKISPLFRNYATRWQSDPVYLLNSIVSQYIPAFPWKNWTALRVCMFDLGMEWGQVLIEFVIEIAVGMTRKNGMWDGDGTHFWVLLWLKLSTTMSKQSFDA